MPDIPDTFELTVVNQQGSVYENKVQAVATSNEDGPLSILSGHSNFISIITESLEIHTHSGNTEEIELELGVVRIFNNQVEVYVGIEVQEQWEELFQKQE